MKQWAQASVIMLIELSAVVSVTPQLWVYFQVFISLLNFSDLLDKAFRCFPPQSGKLLAKNNYQCATNCDKLLYLIQSKKSESIFLFLGLFEGGVFRLFLCRFCRLLLLQTQWLITLIVAAFCKFITGLVTGCGCW